MRVCVQVDQREAVEVEEVVQFLVDGVEGEGGGEGQREQEVREEGGVAEEGFVNVEGAGGGLVSIVAVDCGGVVGVAWDGGTVFVIGTPGVDGDVPASVVRAVEDYGRSICGWSRCG